MPKSKAELEAELDALKESNKKLLEESEALKAEEEKRKAEAKRQLEEKAKNHTRSIKDRLDAEPHHWVRVFNTGLNDGVDFAFNYEGIQFRMISGDPIYLAQSVINHLKLCGYPKTKLKQGEAGQPVKVEGFHHNYNVVNCEAPEKLAV